MGVHAFVYERAIMGVLACVRVCVCACASV